VSLTATQKMALRALIEEIEAAQDHVAKLYVAAKERGLDPAMMRKIIALRKRPPRERMVEEARLADYLGALTPLLRAVK
jgi:uncharacterized protein (UPF0335 family)